MADIETNLHPKNNTEINLKPNIVGNNIPAKAVTFDQLDQNLQDTITNHGTSIASTTAKIAKIGPNITTDRLIIDNDQLISNKFIGNDGKEYGADSYTKVSDYIQIVGYDRLQYLGRYNSGGNVVSFYDLNKNYISGYAGTTSYQVLDIRIPENAGYLRITTNVTDGFLVISRFTDLIVKTDYSIGSTDLLLRYASISISNGQINSIWDVNHRVTDYLYIKGCNHIEFTTSSYGDELAYAFYDANFNLLDGLTGINTKKIFSFDKNTIPANAVYLRVAFNLPSTFYVKCRFGRYSFPAVSSGNYSAQALSDYPVFSNSEAHKIYYRKLGNIWSSDFNDCVVNPVVKADCPDPSYIKVGEYFYLFGTSVPCPIYKSSDLVNWSRCSQVFGNLFDFRSIPSFYDAWANDINRVGDKFIDYITVSAGGVDDNYVIAMTADNIEGPYSYGGIIIPSHTNGGPVSQPIDAELASDGTNYYLFFGSPDVYCVKLSSDGLTKEGGYIHIGKDAGEASYVFKYKNYYYLFNSTGNYTDYTYRIQISRSTNITGPYLNKEGKDINYTTTWVSGTLILHSEENDELFGPGHNAEITTDVNGDMYMILHCHIRGVGYDRPDIIMRIVEGPDGWLAFADKDGNVVTKPTWECSIPKFN